MKYINTMQYTAMIKKVKWSMKHAALSEAAKELFEDFLTAPAISREMVKVITQKLKNIENTGTDLGKKN